MQLIDSNTDEDGRSNLQNSSIIIEHVKHLHAGFHLEISYILGGKLTDRVAVRPRRGKGSIIILEGKLGQFGGKLSRLGGGGGGGQDDETLPWLITTDYCAHVH